MASAFPRAVTTPSLAATVGVDAMREGAGTYAAQQASPPLYLLAGGQSRRFGSDKARFELDGLPLLLHAARSLAPCSGVCTVVADRADKYADLGLRTIPDRVVHRGPLGGLHAALLDLHRADGSWALVSSCDRLGLQCGWIEELWRAAVDATGGRVAAVAFRDEQRWYPFPGLYHRDLVAAVETLLGQRTLALQQLLDQSCACAVALPSQWEQTLDINALVNLS